MTATDDDATTCSLASWRPRRPRFSRTRRAVAGLGRAGARRHRQLGAAAAAGGRALARAVRVAAEYALTVAGLALITAAAATVHRALGFLVAGLACLALEYDISVWRSDQTKARPWQHR